MVNLFWLRAVWMRALLWGAGKQPGNRFYCTSSRNLLTQPGYLAGVSWAPDSKTTFQLRPGCFRQTVTCPPVPATRERV
jgi:hypothetical protein